MRASRRGLRAAVAWLALAVLAAPARAEEGRPARPYSFAVLGHVRGSRSGELSSKLPQLLERLRELRPAFVVLTGDIIWGEVQTQPVDSARVERQWDEIDSALATLGVPVYRVPGNHDISDAASRDIYFRRYGAPPQVVSVNGSRLILLSSAWIPRGDEPRPRWYIRPPALDSAQVGFLARELSGPTRYDHTFVFMHHMLWWKPEAAWWREAHPLLVRAGVRWVFGGDYGPMKFSHLERDGVRYLQSSIEEPVSLPVLRRFESSRLLSSQFDNFFLVTVDGPEASVRVQTVAEFDEQFTPARYLAMTARDPDEHTLARRLRRFLGSPTRLLGAGMVVGLTFSTGMLTGIWWRRRRR